MLVPVVVRNKDGRAIANLERGAFQLFDNGRLQPITSFSEEHASPSPNRAETPEHFVAYFFDDLALSDVSAIAPMREAALKNIANLQTSDRVAILSSSCRVAQDFTGDRPRLVQTLAKLAPDAYPACRFAPAISLQIVLLRDLVHRMRTLPGARSIVVLSSGFHISNNQQAARDQLIDDAIGAKITLNVLHVTSDGARQRYAGDLIGHEGLRSQEDKTTAPKYEPPDPSSLYMIARGTGGEIIEATNSSNVALRTVSTPECYYVLGFVAPGAADGRYHKLKVKLNDARKLTVRAREGYYALARPATLETPIPASETHTEQPKATPAETRDDSPEIALSSASSVALPKPVAERSTTREPIMFSTRTNLVLVPVVVRDTGGRAVGNLQKRNFQVWDKKERQEITTFNLEKGERIGSPLSVPLQSKPRATITPAPPAVPRTFIAYVFDDVHITISDLAQVREAVWQNITRTLGPLVRIAVVTTSGRGSMLDFTDDRDKIHSALYRVVPNPVFRSQCFLCRDLSFVHAYKVLKGDRQALQLAVPIVTGGSTPSTVGLAQRLNPLSYTPLEMQAETKAIAVVNAGEHETELSLHTLRDLSRRMASLAGSRAIVLLGHGFFVPDDLQSDLADTIDHAIRAGVVIHTLNSEGLNPGGLGFGSGYDDDRVGPTSNTGMGAPSPYVHEAELYGSMTLGVLADGTGGTAIENTNDYLSAGRRLAAPPEYWYVLGISPRNLAPNGEFHRLTIRVADIEEKGLTMQSRRGYYAPKRAEGLTEAAAKEIESAIFARDELRDLPVEMRTEISRSEGRAPEVSVFADVDLKSLQFRQSDGRNSEDVTAVVAIFDRDGNFIAGKQQLLKLRLRDETVAALEKQPPETLRTTFDVGAGTYLVRLVVRSSVQQNMTAMSRSVEIP